MQLIQDIAEDLNAPVEMLYEALRNSRKQVKHIKMEKRNGAIRVVYQPSKKTKILQYWLINSVFQNMPIHPAATAFLVNKSIKTNALRHKKGRYFLKLDIKDFFPSIRFADFSPLVSSWLNEGNREIDEKELLEIIRLTCFYIEDRLPVGYPSSPIISNVIMNDFDSQLAKLFSDAEKYGSVEYTRYADDMTFSTDLKGACNRIKILVEKKLKEMGSPKFELNDSKTCFVSSSGGSALVTGLRVCHDGHITIHRRYKDKIRLMLSLYSKGSLNEKEIPSLKGHLSYIHHVDGRFYTKLQAKYFTIIREILSVS